MAMSDELRSCFARAINVIDDHIIGGEIAWNAIDDDDRKASRHLELQVGLARCSGHQEQAVHAPRDEVVDKLSLPFSFFVEAGREHDNPMFAHRVIERAQQCGRIVVATLVMLGAAGGLSIVLTGGAPIGDGPVNAILLTVPILGPFSIPVIIVVVITVYLGLVLHLSRFGRYTYAIGSNSFAALVAGINVNRHLIKIYMLSGLLAGLAGMFFYIRLASGAPTSGLNSELNAIAAVVIGGAALSGGVGVLSGTVLGALILTTITSGLIIIGVAPDWKQVVVALLIAFAVLAQSVRLTNRRAS